MSKHAPGPWYADHEEAPTAIAPADGPAICHVYDTEAVALIASAPELLAAAKAFLLEVRLHYAGTGPGGDAWWRHAPVAGTYTDLTEAIKKAEGKP